MNLPNLRSAIFSIALLVQPFVLVAQTPVGGSLDSTFATSGIRQFSLNNKSLEAADVAFASNGAVYVVGTSYAPGSPAFGAYVMKLTSSGALDTTFNTTGTLSVPTGEEAKGRCIAVLSDGTVRVGCYSSTAFIVVALNSNGTTLTSYGTSGVARVALSTGKVALYSMVAQADNKVLLLGRSGQTSSSQNTGLVNARLARLTTTGSLDSTFAGSGAVSIAIGTESRVGTSLELLSSGATMVAVSAGNGTNLHTNVYRYLTDGTRDPTYGSSGTLSLSQIPFPTGLATDASGNTTILGTDPLTNRVIMMRVGSTGTVDKTFSNDGVATFSIGTAGDAPWGIVRRAADGRLFAANTATTASGSQFNLLRVRPDGELDPNFDADGSVTTPIGVGMNTCSNIRMQSDGKLVLVGASQSTSTAPQTGFAVARYNPGATETDAAPTIASQPGNVTVPLGSPASFTFGITGNLTATYLWKKNNVNMSSPTTATLSFPAVQVSDEGTYKVTATTTLGAVTSNNATLTVIAPPVVQSHPQDVTAKAGAMATFTVSVTGRTPFTYQWQKEGVNYGPPTTGTSSTTNTLSVPVEEVNEGSYRCVITNSENTATSNAAALVSNPDPPVVVTSPSNQTLFFDATATFTFTVSGRTPFTYQWQKDGVDYGAPTTGSISVSNTLQITAVDANEGAYRCVITNSDGSATSEAATLTANPNLPVVVIPPQAQTVATGTLATFTVMVSGRTPFAYQWQKDGVDFGSQVTGDATGTHSLQVTASHANEGDYRVVITNADGFATSVAAALTSQDHAPVITADPVSNELLAGTASTVSVAATGRSPFTFQWQKNGANEGSPITQAGGSHTINVPAGTAATQYRCVVTNDDGTATSKTATISWWSSGTLRLTPVDQLLALGDSMTLVTQLLHPSATVTSNKWLKDNRALSTLVFQGPSITMSPLIADAGTYKVSATTTLGPVTSNDARVAVVDASERTMSGALGKSMTLTAKVAGPGLAYRWRKGTSILSNGGRISGADKVSLVVSGLTVDDAGDYICEVMLGALKRDAGKITVVVESVKPAVTTSSFSRSRIGRPFDVKLAASHTPNSFTATPLPKGLSLDASTGRITGKPLAVGTFQVKVTATNAVGTSPTVTLPLIIDPMFDAMPGSYTGVVGNSMGTASLTVSVSGEYTGKLVLRDGTKPLVTQSFSGVMTEETDGSEGYYVSTSSQMVLGDPFVMKLEWHPSSGFFDAQLESPDWSGQPAVALFKNTWNATSKPAKAFAGYYTMALNASPPSSEAANFRGVAGYGYASCTIANGGTFALSGKMPDGAAFTCASFVDVDGVSPIFTWMYGNKGCLTSLLSFQPGNAPLYVDSKIDSLVFWCRPASTPQPIYPLSNRYTIGFEDYTLNIEGARYFPPGKDMIMGPLMLDAEASTENVLVRVEDGVLGLNPDLYGETIYGGIMVDARATLTSSNALLPVPMADPSNISPGDVRSDVKIDALTFVSATGMFTGKGSYAQRSLDSNGRLVVDYTAPLAFQGVVVTTPIPTPSTHTRALGFFVNTLSLKLEDEAGNKQTFPILQSGGVSVYNINFAPEP